MSKTRVSFFRQPFKFSFVWKVGSLPAADECVCKYFKEAEDRKDNPVHHPVYIFFHVFCFDSFVRTIGRVQHPVHHPESNKVSKVKFISISKYAAIYDY
jgi:hypothetical protein